MLYESALTIHVTAVGAAVLSMTSGELALLLARRGKRGPARLAVAGHRWGNTLAGLGVLAGIVLVFAGGWSPLSPWLLESFVLIAILLAVGRRFVRPWEARAGSALSTSATKATIGAFASDPRALCGRVTIIVLLVTVAAVMSFKPSLV